MHDLKELKKLDQRIQVLVPSFTEWPNPSVIELNLDLMHATIVQERSDLLFREEPVRMFQIKVYHNRNGDWH